MTNRIEKRDPVEILGEEYLARRRRGQAPTIKQFASAHPEYADQIEALFPAMIAMEELKQRRRDSEDRPIRLQVDRLESIGDFEIIREIGHGGMGIVYEAHQKSLNRKVAVKVFPRQSIGNTQQLRRFRREAETIGALHHSNIVPVFAIGEQDGLHYFAMQFLKGVPLDRVIENLASLPATTKCENFFRRCMELDEQPEPVDELQGPDLPSTSNRFNKAHWRRVAELGTQVAEALEYAHSHGVLHRDIKPSNLILSDDFRVWVTDFGLAVTGQHERLSRSGDVVGTLRYMSPEQLNGRADARSDVYGLGLTLYELITLRPAFEGESRGSLIRKVAKSSPPSLRSLCPSVPRDLETIVLKAIARAPESRYRNAQELADDLRRFANDQPIHARRISAPERLCRWSRRNPAVAGMTLALVFGAMLSFAAVTWNWQQAVNEKQHAEREENRAESNLLLALESMDRFLERFESDWMAHPMTSNDRFEDVRFVASPESAAVLEDALQFYHRFAQQNASNPKLQREIAKAYRRAGDIQERLGRYEEAATTYQSSADMLMSLAAENPASDLVIDTADVLNRLAMVLHFNYQGADAQAVLLQARSLLNDRVLTSQSPPEFTFQLAITHSNLGAVQWRMHRGEESADNHRRAILLLEGLTEEDQLSARYRLTLARAYANYFQLVAQCNDHIYAGEIRRSATELLEELVHDYPDVPDYQCELSELLTMAIQVSGSSDQSKLRLSKRAVQLSEHLNQQFPEIPRYQMALANALSAYAIGLRSDNSELALESHQRAVRIVRQLSAKFPNVVSYHMILGSILHRHGETLQAAGRIEECIGALEDAVNEQNAYLNQHPDSDLGRHTMAQYLNVLAQVLQETGDSQRSQELTRHARTFWKARPQLEPNP